MSCDQNYPFPEVFLVESGGSPQRSAQPPGLQAPSWSFPAAQERVRSRGKSRGFMGVSPSLAMMVLMLFLLVFAALGFEAFQVHNMQTELAELRGSGQSEPPPEIIAPQKQIGDFKPKDKENRLAAHVIGRIENGGFRETLRWEPKVSRAFISGGVTYRIEDGGLQVNESGLFHIYSRVELIFKTCSPKSSFVHSMFMRRKGHPSPLTLMNANRAGFCSHQPQHPWTSESYLGSAMQLQKYDTVFVNVSHPRLLSHERYGNFFGLYKI
ncbi:tumor necrosis factor ligand superfamily member 6-like [Solea senegalensis]|uniref:Tumor necrosis factor ligand superfamily member 6-like n=1 Tax=Solea senegalensis TaxID=28829 RepID=A0AAV6PQT9_SOLSE|nr:tumor necrosis factor ligand superfamily member 6 [Solea senegalensis]KAG7471720.1 tumor necrosis factor ligand superfamily member 6-like [Solea senegalensis]